MKNVMNAVVPQKCTGKAQALLLGLLAFSPIAAFAQSGTTIDTTTVLAYIAAGVVAAGAIGAAWTGLKYLIKVWRKV